MTLRPRTIQIFLPTGDPRGIRVAELTTSIVRVIEIPRSLLAQFQAMPEAKQVGIYFLIGESDNGEATAVYVGQTGSLGERLANHHKAKEFWNRAFVVVSLTNSLTQTHALFLEWCSIQQAIQASRYAIKNGNSGSKPHTPAPLEADCMDVFDTARTLLATLGQPIFEPVALAKSSITTQDIFYMKGPGYEAEGEYTEEGFVVLKGSKARIEVKSSASTTWFAKRRATLLAEETLKEENGFYVFQKDVLFKTPSGASDTVSGTSTNGWLVWKSKDGKTLDELKRKPLVEKSDELLAELDRD
ncbi:MAG: GIY-YIG nuclease family protein [Burkholderiales bacterium]|nr:GIY-YIG nuclease family protein [Burkholderiales bacterium]